MGHLFYAKHVTGCFTCIISLEIRAVIPISEMRKLSLLKVKESCPRLFNLKGAELRGQLRFV